MHPAKRRAPQQQSSMEMDAMGGQHVQQAEEAASATESGRQQEDRKCRFAMVSCSCTARKCMRPCSCTPAHTCTPQCSCNPAHTCTPKHVHAAVAPWPQLHLNPTLHRPSGPLMVDPVALVDPSPVLPGPRHDEITLAFASAAAASSSSSSAAASSSSGKQHAGGGFCCAPLLQHLVA